MLEFVELVFLLFCRLVLIREEVSYHLKARVTQMRFHLKQYRFVFTFRPHGNDKEDWE